MTLGDILSAALEQLGRTVDAQQQAKWRAKFTQIINEGLIDIAEHLKPRRTDTLCVTDGEIDVRALPRECTKVLGVFRDGAAAAFSRGSETARLRVCAEGEVQVQYRYIPKALSSDSDEPELPPRLHALLVTYVCAREYQSRDENTQRRSNPYFTQYMQAKERARQDCGEPESCAITGVVW